MKPVKNPHSQGTKHVPGQGAGNLHSQRQRAAQLKTAMALQTKNPPVAYRPQAVPQVLQSKPARFTHHAPFQAHVNCAGQSASRPFHTQTRPAITSQKTSAVQARIINQQQRPVSSPAPKVFGRAPAIHRAAAVQRFRSGVVQATKFYPNLHPGAAAPVDRSNIFTLDSFADQYRLHRINSHAVNVPNMKYNFVRNREGAILLHNRYRHPSLAEGEQVLYAGEIFFNNGKLQWWSNGSGHYQPDADGAEQANLPMDYFYSYQQIIKGEHTRK